MMEGDNFPVPFHPFEVSWIVELWEDVVDQMEYSNLKARSSSDGLTIPSAFDEMARSIASYDDSAKDAWGF
jgi:hypothetical protein